MAAPGYRPVTWLPGGHAMTIWAYLFKRTPQVACRREILMTPDGAAISVDRVDGAPGAPLVLALHGLEGSSKAPYIRRLMSHIEARGWSGVAMNARGCDGAGHPGPTSYHAGYGADVLSVLEHLSREGEGRPLFLVGYSLGASMMAHALGARPERVPTGVKAAFLVAPPLSLAPGAEALQRGFTRVYQFRFLRTLRRKARRLGRLHPEVREAADAAWRSRTLRDFDDAWVAPVHGFDGADDYYRRASAREVLTAIAVPTAVLHAWDDPIVVPDSVPQEVLRSAPSVELLDVAHGGHVGFVCAGNTGWLEETALNWLGSQGT